MQWTAQDLAIVRDQVLRGIVETGGAGTKVGIVNSVSNDRLRATVTMTDATAATPVKVAGHCWCLPDDKVGLTRFGSEWYVTAVLSRVTGPSFVGYSDSSPGGNTTSSSPVNMPGNPQFTFVKHWDSTPIMIGGWASIYHGLSFGDCSIHLRFVDADGVATTYKIYGHTEGDAELRNTIGGARVVPDPDYTSPLPAGTYTVFVRWSTSAGQINQNTGDWTSAIVLEGGVS